MDRPRAWIGTSGYNYDHWRGDFYPAELPTRRWLSHYAQRFETVEINYSFYRLPTRTTFAIWGTQVPPTFRFVIKGSRFLTHVKRLTDARDGVVRLREAADPLLDRIAAVLWQLPPQMKADPERLRDFLVALQELRGPRHAFEFRHASWFTGTVARLLDDAGATFSFADGKFPLAPERHPWQRGPTAPVVGGWVYVRRHGPGRMYHGSYSPAALAGDADWLRGQVELGREAFVYYNNDLGGHAPRNAATLDALVNGKGPPKFRRGSRRRAPRPRTAADVARLFGGLRRKPAVAGSDPTGTRGRIR